MVDFSLRSLRRLESRFGYASFGESLARWTEEGLCAAPLLLTIGLLTAFIFRLRLPICRDWNGRGEECVARTITVDCSLTNELYSLPTSSSQAESVVLRCRREQNDRTTLRYRRLEEAFHLPDCSLRGASSFACARRSEADYFEQTHDMFKCKRCKNGKQTIKSPAMLYGDTSTSVLIHS